MRMAMRAGALGMLAALGLGAAALAQTVTVPQGTPVTLVFDQAISSKTAKEGQPVALHVRDNVNVNGTTVVPAGTRVTGLISKVEKRKRYGVNANLRIALNPVRLANGQTVLLEARSQSKRLHGKKSDQAAAATAGGAIVAGPVGLIGGYFIHGKPVNIKPGDTFDTAVARTTVIRR